MVARRRELPAATSSEVISRGCRRVSMLSWLVAGALAYAGPAHRCARVYAQFSHPQLVVVQPAVSNYKRKGRGESVCAVATGAAVELRGRAARTMP